MTRKALLVLAVSSLCGVLAAPLGAEALRPLGHFDIPFQFVVNGKAMPAGEYIVEVRGSDDVISIESKRDHSRRMFCAFPAGTAIVDDAKLTFRRYGDTYFLARISTPEGGRVIGLSVSRAERQVAKAAVPVRSVVLAAIPAHH